LAWRDTARCLGVRSLVSDDDQSGAFARNLPRPARAQLAPRPTIAGLLITKDEQATVEAAVRSLASFVDEVIVVDDYSSDETPNIAAALGARVIERSLNGNFAAQRNAGLAEVRSRWVVSIDADEVLDPALVPLIERAIRWPRADVVFVPRLTLINEHGSEPAFWPDMQPKVFRSNLRYRGAVHETIRWRRALFAPLSGPHVIHRKSLARQHRATLLYNEIDPTPYAPETIAGVRAELADLEMHGE